MANRPTPWGEFKGPYEVFAFLTDSDCEYLRGIADAANGWTPGRQNTGYNVLPLFRWQHIGRVSELIDRALAVIEREILGDPSQFDKNWDAYLVWYPNGTSIPTHRDKIGFGHHRRLNALITAPTSGGELIIEGKVVDLQRGFAVMFHPDEVDHSVTEVLGERLVFSVGAVL